MKTNTGTPSLPIKEQNRNLSCFRFTPGPGAGEAGCTSKPLEGLLGPEPQAAPWKLGCSLALGYLLNSHKIFR